MIRIGAQYYRPPFPNRRYWQEDMARMADAGLNTVQLWVVWAWVEPMPDKFRFEDYDELIELADKNGLGVVLSTIGAIHPYWIHRVVPGSEMIDHMGHKVISSNRAECHYGMTPGGCTDHPGVWERMANFLEEVVLRYRSAPNLVGWDAWNELRWNVNADGIVCYCPYTINRFHTWLDAVYGGLEGLNAAWQTRFPSWEEVRPGKLPRSPYTLMMAWQHFLTWRATDLGLSRYDVIKNLDPDRVVTVHGGAPTVLYGMQFPDTALNRGNDWFFADEMDGIGCSSFPTWFHFSDADLAMRIECVRSAARGKRIWLSELQGGRAAHGFEVHDPVLPDNQQRWVWTGISSGADTILFWCWRDEVFGQESAGFGLIGNDGFAEARLEALRKTANILQENEALFANYKPDPPQVGIYFSPQSYYLYWNQEGHAGTPQRAIQGYMRGLLRSHIPYTVVEEEHLEVLEDLKVLFMPRAVVVDYEQARALAAWVRAGGTLVCESECGAFGRNGLYRYPEDRFLAELTGVAEIGRRALPDNGVIVSWGGEEWVLPAKQWMTPFTEGVGRVLGRTSEGPLFVEVPVEKGRVILCGTYLGDAYFEGTSDSASPFAPHCQGFERFLNSIVQEAGVQKPIEIVACTGAPGDIYVRMGHSAGRPVAFIFHDGSDHTVASFLPGTFTGNVRDLITGETFPLRNTCQGQECHLGASPWGLAILVEEAPDMG